MQPKNKLANPASFEPPITSSLRYSVREYISKTRDVVLLRHSVETKKESALKMEEDYTNQIQSVRESINSLKQTKNLFEDNFIVKFDKYVKYLRLQREKEISELNAILDFKSQVELEIQKLESRRFKTKARLGLFREYRDFLICVKQRVICLPAFFTQNENYKKNIPNLIEFQKSKKKFDKNNFGNFNNSTNSNNSNNYNSINNFALQVNDGNYSDLDSEMDEEERNRIIQEREKRQKMRNQLLNQLQASNKSNENLTATNSNNNLNSPKTRTSKHVFNTNASNNNVNNNKKNNNNQLNKNFKKNNQSNFFK